MRFYDLDMKSNFSVGTSSIKELAEFAKKLGYAGIAICDNFQGFEKLRQQKAEIEQIKDIQILLGVEIQPRTKEELKQLVEQVRPEVSVLCVHGGDYQINRAACEDSRVDILAHPELGRIDNGLDEACLNAAAKNSVAIQINFREILYSYRKPRSYIFGHIATNIRLCTELNAPLIICSGAQSIWDMRDPRELIAIANVLGLELSRAFFSVMNIPEQIIERRK